MSPSLLRGLGTWHDPSESDFPFCLKGGPQPSPRGCSVPAAEAAQWQQERKAWPG